MLAGLAGLLSVLGGGCAIDEQAPTLPSWAHAGSGVVTQQVSDGCTRCAFQVVNSVSTVEALDNTNKRQSELNSRAPSTPSPPPAQWTSPSHHIGQRHARINPQFHEDMTQVRLDRDH